MYFLPIIRKTNAHTQLTLRIDWSKIDLFGHVNNVAFFKYMQAACVNYREEAGINQLHKEQNIGPTLTAVNCRLKKNTLFSGRSDHSNKNGIDKKNSFQLAHQLYNTAGELAAEGEDIVVLFDYHTQQKTEIPESIRVVIQ